jgi:hypothetical protein
VYLKSKYKLTYLTIISISCVALLFFITLESRVHAKHTPSSELQAEKIVFGGEIKNLSGPWGDLEVDPIILQASASYYSDYSKYNNTIDTIKSSGQWTFKNTSPDKINLIFENAGINKDLCDVLIKNTKPIPDGSGFITTPPDSVLLKFTPENRAKLYPEIGKFEGNTLYTTPFHYVSENPQEWFFHSSLPKDVVEKLLTMVYVRDGMCQISDLNLIVPELKTQEDWDNLLQTLYRTPALTVYLKIGKGQDISGIAGYWGNLNRIKDVKPILERMSNSPKGGKIDIEELLPTIPQSMMNTFVSGEEAVKNNWNCMWTTFNFFNGKSDERLTKSADTELECLKGIAKPAQGNYQPKFGDIIILTDKNGITLHSCVYIADNIVYTKNGKDAGIFNTPFCLSYFDKVQTLYNFHQDKINTVFGSRIKADTQQIKLSN